MEQDMSWSQAEAEAEAEAEVEAGGRAWALDVPDSANAAQRRSHARSIHVIHHLSSHTSFDHQPKPVPIGHRAVCVSHYGAV